MNKKYLLLIIIFFILLTLIMVGKANVISPNPVGEPSFETITGWYFTSVDLGTPFLGGQTTSWATNLTNSYVIYYDGATSIGYYGQVTRSVNFAGVHHITFDWKRVDNWGGDNIAQVFIGGTLAWSNTSYGAGTILQNATIVNIPSGTQTANLTFRYGQIVSGITHVFFYIDNITSYSDIVPTSPQISFPSNNNRHYNNSINFTWNISTDADGDSITGYDFWLSSQPDFSNTINRTNYSNNWTGNIATIKGQVYYGKVRSNDSYEYSAWSSTVQFWEGKPALISPANRSTVTTLQVPFSWFDEETSYTFVLARDLGFTNIIRNQTLSTNSITIPIFEDDEYFWKVGLPDGNWSTINSFNLTSTSLSSGDGTAGIQGYVYEALTLTPISNVVVYTGSIYTTDTTTTDSNGYYLFRNLSNNTLYSLKATKQNYIDSEVVYTYTVNGSWVTKNIVMVPVVSTAVVFKSLPHNVKFVVMDWYGNPQQNVIVTVQGYNTTTGTFSFLSELLGLSSSQSPLLSQNMSGSTRQDGSINFMMEPTVNYNIIFTKGTAINLNWWLYPKEDYYLLSIPPSSTLTNSGCANIVANLTHTPYNSTHETLGLTYSDPSGSTTLINFYVKDVNGTYLNSTTSMASTWSPFYYVNSSVVGTTYFWGYNATTLSCSNQVGQVQVITFRGSGRLIDLGFSDPAWYQWISIILITVTATIFSVKKVKFGAIVVPFSAAVYVGFGWFTISTILLGCAIVIGVLVYFRLSETKVVY